MTTKSICKLLTWPYIITGCGVLSLAFSSWATVAGIYRLQTDPSIRVFPLAWAFTYLFGFIVFISWRLAARRIWAGIVAALLGWFLINDLLTSPVAKSQMNFGMWALIAAILILTVSLFAGRESWKRGF
jgi:hypothetical protein